MRTDLLIIFGILASVGLAGLWLLVVGIRRLMATIKFYRTAARIDGVVVAVDVQSSGGMGLTYSPVIEFFDENVKLHKITTNLRTYKQFKVGDGVKVLYGEQAGKSRAVRNELGHIFFGCFAWIASGGGLVTLVLFFAYLFVQSRAL
jgi:hypothetical protein